MRLLRSLVALFPSLACAGLGGKDLGIRQLATGGGPLEVTLTGPMSGTLSIAPASTAHLTSQVGLYDPGPPYPRVREGAWVATRTVSEPATADGGWMLEGEIAGDGLTWTGDCGPPAAFTESHGASVMVFPGPPTSTVYLLVPLAGQGSATFQGEGVGPIGDQGELVAKGQWSLAWCGEDTAERVIGPGEVRVRWRLDPARLSWPAPRRGAL